MMHFSIPETVDHRDLKGSYTTYEIHMNGVHHCSVRYRQLHALHENLRREFPPSTLPSFPPKKILPLTIGQVEERRLGLEKYLQLLSQDPRVVSGVSFNGFLLGAQQETHDEKMMEVDLDVFLMNDHKILVRGITIMQTEEVLERVCQQLGVPDELVFYFALFLIRRDVHRDRGMTIVRKLQDFESPYTSQKIDKSSKLVMRKCSWDPQIDDILLSNKVTLNLLYTQTVSDVELKWVQGSQEIEKQLARLQARGAKMEYMETARHLKDYGFVHFMPCFCDYPRSHTNAQVLIGGRDLILRISGVDGEVKEGKFRVTKMRCWRIMTLTSSQSKMSDLIEDNSTKLELSFEYLMGSGEMQWITLVSSQAIIMSLCLQSIVEEMLRLRNGGTLRRGGEKTVTRQYTYKRADGSEMTVPVRTSATGTKIEMTNYTKKSMENDNGSSLFDRQYSVKKLSEKFSVVNMRDASRAAENVLIENEAFHELKDEDL